jgi:hypothetical protein
MLPVAVTPKASLHGAAAAQPPTVRLHSKPEKAKSNRVKNRKRGPARQALAYVAADRRKILTRKEHWNKEQAVGDGWKLELPVTV